MNCSTTQRHFMAAGDVARVRDVYVAANDLMGNGSWSIPCTATFTDHKPRPRRPQVISS